MPAQDELKATSYLAERRLQFGHLPGYAKFILENRLDQLVKFNLKISRDTDFHLMKYFDFMSEEQIIDLSKTSNTAFLTAIIENTLDEYIDVSIGRWKANQLPLIARDQIIAEDMALTAYISKMGFRKFLPEYTNDIELCI